MPAAPATRTEPLTLEAEGPERTSMLPSYSVWDGRYTCSQGLTAVHLVLDATRAGEVVATFAFGPLDENPGVPSGSIRMIGSLRMVARRLELQLAPDRWIVQPPGWLMVGVTAESDLAQRVMRGRIIEPTCGDIELRRSD